jgi:hypothetical protein
MGRRKVGEKPVGRGGEFLDGIEGINRIFGGYGREFLK